jgi:hypothetical protein
MSKKNTQKRTAIKSTMGCVGTIEGTEKDTLVIAFTHEYILEELYGEKGEAAWTDDVMQTFVSALCVRLSRCQPVPPALLLYPNVVKVVGRRPENLTVMNVPEADNDLLSRQRTTLYFVVQLIRHMRDENGHWIVVEIGGGRAQVFHSDNASGMYDNPWISKAVLAVLRKIGYSGILSSHRTRRSSSQDAAASYTFEVTCRQPVSREERNYCGPVAVLELHERIGFGLPRPLQKASSDFVGMREIITGVDWDTRGVAARLLVVALRGVSCSSTVSDWGSRSSMLKCFYNTSPVCFRQRLYSRRVCFCDEDDGLYMVLLSCCGMKYHPKCYLKSTKSREAGTRFGVGTELECHQCYGTYDSVFLVNRENDDVQGPKRVAGFGGTRHAESSARRLAAKSMCEWTATSGIGTERCDFGDSPYVESAAGWPERFAPAPVDYEVVVVDPPAPAYARLGARRVVAEVGESVRAGVRAGGVLAGRSAQRRRPSDQALDPSLMRLRANAAVDEERQRATSRIPEQVLVVAQDRGMSGPSQNRDDISHTSHTSHTADSNDSGSIVPMNQDRDDEDEEEEEEEVAPEVLPRLNRGPDFGEEVAPELLAYPEPLSMFQSPRTRVRVFRYGDMAFAADEGLAEGLRDDIIRLFVRPVNDRPYTCDGCRARIGGLQEFFWHVERGRCDEPPPLQARVGISTSVAHFVSEQACSILRNTTLPVPTQRVALLNPRAPCYPPGLHRASGLSQTERRKEGEFRRFADRSRNFYTCVVRKAVWLSGGRRPASVQALPECLMFPFLKPLAQWPETTISLLDDAGMPNKDRPLHLRRIG